MMFSFEDRFYTTHEIKTKFAIKDKTWRIWLYGDKKRRKNKQDMLAMGLVKVPGTNYYVVDPVKFQDWFKELCGVEE